jgi:hypothetical protein
VRALAQVCRLPEYLRPRHRTVARILKALDAGVLADAHCYFGGGTRIALELDEYRESEDIDFICSDIVGYRTLRSAITDGSLGKLMRKSRSGVSLLREVRTDQYGIRTVIGVDGAPVKFEIILEARVQVTAMKVQGIPVPALSRVSCFAEKWLANADRWNDTAVLSRDAIDLACMMHSWEVNVALAGANLAIQAYGAAVGKAARAAAMKLLDDKQYRKHCIENLAITNTKSLIAGLKALAKTAKSLR